MSSIHIFYWRKFTGKLHNENIILWSTQFSPHFHKFTGSKTIFAKNKIAFLAQKLENKIFLSKSVSSYYKTKKKKWHGPLSHWCRDGKTLVVRPLKKPLFLCVSSLSISFQSKLKITTIKNVTLGLIEREIYIFLKCEKKSSVFWIFSNFSFHTINYKRKKTKYFFP